MSSSLSNEIHYRRRGKPRRAGFEIFVVVDTVFVVDTVVVVVAVVVVVVYFHLMHHTYIKPRDRRIVKLVFFTKNDFELCIFTVSKKRSKEN